MRLENLLGSRVLELIERLGLLLELVHAFLARAGDRLIGRDHHALHRRPVVQGLQRHHELDRGTVRIGDDVLLLEAVDRRGVHLRHDERHVGIVAPGRRIIDHDAALGRDLQRPFLGDRRARRHQTNVGAGEVVILQRLHLKDSITIGNFGAHRAARGERHHLVGGKAALGKHVQHLPADVAGGSCDRDLVTHR